MELWHTHSTYENESLTQSSVETEPSGKSQVVLKTAVSRRNSYFWFDSVGELFDTSSISLVNLSRS
jgi:hypothetical protein